jgi:hypothetical protein
VYGNNAILHAFVKKLLQTPNSIYFHITFVGLFQSGLLSQGIRICEGNTTFQTMDEVNMQETAITTDCRNEAIGWRVHPPPTGACTCQRKTHPVIRFAKPPG